MNFVYRLGVGRFDELLYAEIDEGIRTFVNGIWLNQVFDLKGATNTTSTVKTTTQLMERTSEVEETSRFLTKIETTSKLLESTEEVKIK